MNLVLVLAIAMVLVFAFVDGVTGAATATATLVASRAANPGPAVILAALFNLAGPFLFGTAVAGTIGAVVALSGERLIPVIGAGAFGALTWTAITWRLAIPSSSSHALVGGLLGAALLDAGPGAINWAGPGGGGPVGVIGILAALALTPVAPPSRATCWNGRPCARSPEPPFEPPVPSAPPSTSRPPGWPPATAPTTPRNPPA